MFTFDKRLRCIWNSISRWLIWNDDRTKMIVSPSFQLATRLNSKNSCDTEIHVELWNINLYMNTGFSNSYFWSIEPTKMMFLPLFQFETRLLTSKHPKFFSTYLVEQNGAMWKMCFSAAQNAKNKFQLKHKTKYETDDFLSVISSSMKHYTWK